MLNKFGEIVKCTTNKCNESDNLFAVGEFRGDHDYKIMCKFHTDESFKNDKSVDENGHYKATSLKFVRLTQEVYEGKHNHSHDYGQYSSQSIERKQLFTSSRGKTSEGRKETAY